MRAHGRSAYSWLVRPVGLSLAIAISLQVAAEAAPLGNGDVNGVEGINISDASFLLGFLFLGTDPPVEIVCPPPGKGPLPATGQTRCYTDGLELDAPCDSVDFPGQDGSYETSCPGEFRFVDNGDGTVTDRCTGLIWQQDTADTDGDGSIGEEDRLTWGQALRYCDQLEFAGHPDWRLPNLRELQSIVDYGRTGGQYPTVIRPRPAPDHAAMDPAFSAVHPEPYWSSTSSVRQPDTAFWVSFGDGHSGGGAVKTAHLFVRAVRVRPDESVLDGAPDPAGPVPSGNGDVNASGTIDVSDAVYLLGWLFLGTDPPVAIPCPPRGGGRLPATGQISCYDESGGTIPCDSVEFPGQDGFHRAGCETEPRFVDNGDGTVTDRCTALVWQKDTADVDQNGSIGEEDLLNWADALQYCDQLEFAHRDDWRLPNVRELFSIADFARFEPAIDPVFGAAPPVGPLRGMYWTSTTHLRTPDDAWTVPVTTGSVTDSQKRVSPVDNNVQFVRAVRGP